MAPTGRPEPRIRILATGWRLASAQVALVIGTAAFAILAVPSLLSSSATMWKITLIIAGLFWLLGLGLLAACRWLVVDVAARRIRFPGGEERPLEDARAIVVTGRTGRAVTGSGKTYRYSVRSLGLLTEAAGVEILDSVATFAKGGDDDTGAGLAHLLESLATGYVLLVDAATERRAERLGRRLADALGVPFVSLEPEDVGGPEAPSAPAPPAEMGGIGA